MSSNSTSCVWVGLTRILLRMILDENENEKSGFKKYAKEKKKVFS